MPHNLKSENVVVNARTVVSEVNALSFWEGCIAVDNLQGFVAGKLPHEAVHEWRREVAAEQPVDKSLEHPSLDEISANIQIDRDGFAVDFVKYQTLHCPKKLHDLGIERAERAVVNFAYHLGGQVFDSELRGFVGSRTKKGQSIYAPA